MEDEIIALREQLDYLYASQAQAEQINITKSSNEGVRN